MTALSCMVGCILALGVIGLGAWVRIAGAGLACPDWPGCFGRLFVPAAPERIEAAQASFPEVPLDVTGARIEMSHRYAAGMLGFLVAAIFLLCWRMRRVDGRPLLPAAVLLSLIIMQALLGLFTISSGLHPFIVTLHLIGGMSALALLVWMTLRQHAGWSAWRAGSPPRSLQALTLAALAAVLLQIALGGWTSARGVIHWPPHQLGALFTALLLVALFFLTRRRASVRWISRGMLLVLIVQLGLGVSNLMLGTPPLLALLHNVFAAILLVSVVAIAFDVFATRTELSS